MPRLPRATIRALKASYSTPERFERAYDFALHALNDPGVALEAKVRIVRAVLPYEAAQLVRPGKEREAEILPLRPV